MKILFYTNGQKQAQEVVVFGAELFKYIQPQVTLLSMVEKMESSPQPKPEELKIATGLLKDRGIKAKTKIREGDVAEEILKESREGNYDLLVIGSRGYSDILIGLSEVVLDETVQHVISRVETSLLVGKEPRSLQKVLICTDGSDQAEKAISFFVSLKLDRKIQINIMNVIPEIYSRFKDFLEPVDENQLELLGSLPSKRTEFLYKAKEMLADHGLEARIKLREGNAAEEILKEAENNYDLVVMGFGGRKRIKKNTIGRQTMLVMMQAKIPVLCIK